MLQQAQELCHHVATYPAPSDCQRTSLAVSQYSVGDPGQISAALTVARTFRAMVDQPQRFARSKTVGVHFGFGPAPVSIRRDRLDGRTSKCGDTMMRTLLYEVAQVLLTRT